MELLSRDDASPRLEEDHQVMAVHAVVDYPFFLQDLEGKSYVYISDGHCRYPLLGQEAPISITFE